MPVKIVALSGMVVMATAIAYASWYGDFSREGSLLLEMPWGFLSLVDVYVGFMLFSLWVAWREQSRIIAGAWIVAILLLGNLVSCLYLFLAATNCNGNMYQLLTGKK